MNNSQVAQELIQIASIIAGVRVTAPPAMLSSIGTWAIQTTISHSLWSLRMTLNENEAFIENPKNMEGKTEQQQMAYHNWLAVNRENVATVESLAKKYGVTKSVPFIKVKQRFKVNLSGWEFESEVKRALKITGIKLFSSIVVEMNDSKSKHHHAEAEWHRGNKKITVFGAHVQNQSSVDRLEDTLEHELIHMADDIMNIAGVGLLDVGSGSQYDLRNLKTEDHILSDVEFYTNLNDEIRNLQRWSKQQGYEGELLRQIAEVRAGVRGWVDREYGVKDAIRSYFKILKEGDKMKYQKAVELFLNEF